MRLAITSVSNWPLVMTKTMSKTLSTMISTVVVMVIKAPRMEGMMTWKKIRISPAPSIRAASSSSAGTLLMASAKGGVDGVQQSDLGPLNRLEAVHELPDDGCAHGRDRHRKEDQGLGDRLPAADTADQHGNDQSDRDHAAGAEDQPQNVVARGEQHVRVG